MRGAEAASRRFKRLATRPQCLAVLDWELSTIGHPYADLASVIMQWQLPPGAEGPEHDHHDVEEVFFVLEGELKVTIHDGEDSASTVLGYRDLIKVPPNTPRLLKNVGETDALFCVMLGAPKPQIPTYPPTSPMVGITRDRT